jgi:flagellar hook-length control protein FliK
MREPHVTAITADVIANASGTPQAGDASARAQAPGDAFAAILDAMMTAAGTASATDDSIATNDGTDITSAPANAAAPPATPNDPSRLLALLQQTSTSTDDASSAPDRTTRPAAARDDARSRDDNKDDADELPTPTPANGSTGLPAPPLPNALTEKSDATKPQPARDDIAGDAPVSMTAIPTAQGRAAAPRLRDDTASVSSNDDAAEVRDPAPSNPAAPARPTGHARPSAPTSDPKPAKATPETARNTIPANPSNTVVSAASPPSSAVDPAAVAAPAVPVPAASVATDADADDAAPAADIEVAAATNAAAASVVPAGATAKPVKPADAKAQAADSAKTQPRGGAATVIADANRTATRHFVDEKAVVAEALTPRASGDPAKPATHTTEIKPNPQAPSDASPARTTPDASPTQASSTAPHGQSAQPDVPRAPDAPQPNAASAVPAAGPSAPAATNAAPAANAPQVQAHLEIGHGTAQPDVGTLAFTIASKSEGGARHFDIRLDPPELGRVDVRLSVDDAGKAQAVLTVEKPQTLVLLQNDQSHLQRALKDAGLDLGQNGLAFSLKSQQQQAGGDGHKPSAPRGRAAAARAIAAVGSAQSAISLGQVSAGDTRLDIRV